MKASDLSLPLLAAFTSFLVTASPLPSTCHCATGLPNSFLSLRSSEPRLVDCEWLCDYVSGPLALKLEETEVHLKLEDLTTPIEGYERPLPTSVLMRLSSKSENIPSAPTETAMPTFYYKILSGQDGRHEGLIDGFEQRHLLVILLGLVAIVLVAMAIVESVEQLWKGRPEATFPRRGTILLADELATPYPQWAEVYDEEIYSRRRLASI